MATRNSTTEWGEYIWWDIFFIEWTLVWVLLHRSIRFYRRKNVSNNFSQSYLRFLQTHIKHNMPTINNINYKIMLFNMTAKQLYLTESKAIWNSTYNNLYYRLDTINFPPYKTTKRALTRVRMTHTMLYIRGLNSLFYGSNLTSGTDVVRDFFFEPLSSPLQQNIDPSCMTCRSGRAGSIEQAEHRNVTLLLYNSFTHIFLKIYSENIEIVFDLGLDAIDIKS
ncbi:hypothetical protein AGLY_007966 [Aphis glycines]|uniref:Uncharacterized protein n=1 Tax=Aphis glycines TaxID=307491 RepID=A0A6G0TMA0_APHGL|nr:hypothetical protein AGLY_007966 [Aphis glycines]